MVKGKKIGRNDPCPCGSGKKYKKCCGRLEDIVDVFQDRFTYYNQLISAIKIKLDQYYGDQIKKNRKEYQNQFLRYTVEKTLPAEHETFFSDWLWFDRTDTKGNTPGTRYLNENANFMEKPFLDCLAGLNSSYLSVYEPGEIQDNKLKVIDIFSKEEHQVLLKDPGELENNDNKLLLFGRLVNVPEVTIFSGMVLIIENNSNEKEFLQQHLDYMQKLNLDKSTRLLKLNGEKVYGFFDHAFKKNLMKLNDTRAIKINEEEKSTLLDKLTQDHNYVFVHAAEGFNWYKPEGEAHGYVRFAIGEEYVITCADILEDVLKQEKLLFSILGKKEIPVVSSLILQKPPAIETADLWFLILKDQETERWLDTPHIELDNKTPREVLNKENGQKQLLELLDNFAGSVQSEEEKELIEYMKTRIQ